MAKPLCAKFSAMYSKQKSILCPSAEDMRGLAGCQKIQKSKNPSFQTESLDSGQKDGFLDFPRFFWIFLDSSKGCLDFWVSKSKIQKKLKEKDGFLQRIQLLPACFLDFLEKSIFFLKFFWIFDIRIGKINLFPSFFLDFCKKSIFFLGFFWNFDIRIGKINLFPRFFLDFCKNPSFSLGFLLFLKNPSFSLNFFGFLTWKPKNPNTLSKNPKKSKKTLGNPKIHLFDLNPKILFEKMDFWIFEFLVEQSSEIQDFIFWTWIQVV